MVMLSWKWSIRCVAMHSLQQHMACSASKSPFSLNSLFSCNYLAHSPQCFSNALCDNEDLEDFTIQITEFKDTN